MNKRGTRFGKYGTFMQRTLAGGRSFILASVLSVFVAVSAFAAQVDGVENASPTLTPNPDGKATSGFQNNGELVLFLKSPRVKLNGVFTFIDPSNYQVVPFSKDGRTLVPIRFISEAFGMKVDFDGAKSEVKLTDKNGRITLVGIGKKSMQVGGQDITLDVPAQIIEERTLLPLRKLAEDVLNKKVYFEKSVIIIADQEETIQANKEAKAFADLRESLDIENKPGYYQLTPPRTGDIVATLVTDQGKIKIKLFPKEAPMTVENFVTHSKNGYYDGLTFHRLIKDFMIQGGDPLGNGMGGQSIWGKPFEDEFNKKLVNIRGALSMANSGPNTNGSQFFIVQNARLPVSVKGAMKEGGYPEQLADLYSIKGGAPWLDYMHTVFGQVYEGLDIVDKIVAVPTDANDKPKTPVIIQRVLIETL